MPDKLEKLGFKIDNLRLQLAEQLMLVHDARVALHATPEWKAYAKEVAEQKRVSEKLLKAERDYNLEDRENRDF